MAKRNPIKLLPVTHRDLAFYLGISTSMLNMAEGRNLSRNLPAGVSLKLTELAASHYDIKTSKRPRRSLAKMQPKAAKQVGVLADRMELEIAHDGSRTAYLQTKLDEMTGKYETDMHWLNTIDEKLAAFPASKEPKKDHRWFEYQRILVIERLEKTGIAAQVKLEMQIELARAKAAINKVLLRKLRKEIKS